MIYLITQFLKILSQNSTFGSEKEGNEVNSFNGSWIFRLLLNLLGYATILIPGYVIFKFVKKTKYLERSGKDFLKQRFQEIIK